MVNTIHYAPLNTDMKNVKVIFAYGRMNPPTKGHLRVVEKIREEARLTGGTPRIYLSETHDDERNPLTREQKVAFVSALFPDVEVRTARQLFEATLAMAAEGFEEGVLIVGEDRFDKFSKIMSAYEGTEALGLKRVEVKSISRDANETSASGARAAAKAGNWKAFLDHSATTDTDLTHELYEAVRAGMGV
jgi:nicotinic acid mononucleotide adenylyltransferase